MSWGGSLSGIVEKQQRGCWTEGEKKGVIKCVWRQKGADGTEPCKDFSFTLSEMKSIEVVRTVWYDLKPQLNRSTLADISGLNFKVARVEIGRWVMGRMTIPLFAKNNPGQCVLIHLWMPLSLKSSKCLSSEISYVITLRDHTIAIMQLSDKDAMRQANSNEGEIIWFKVCLRWSPQDFWWLGCGSSEKEWRWGLWGSNI